MPVAEVGENLKSHHKFFQTVSSLLVKKPWFKKGNWIARAHNFPSESPDGVTFHVFKEHWFNDDALGIHFESYRDARPGKDKELYVTLHTLHHKVIPGTKLKREAVSKPFVDRIEAKVRKWKGYSFRAGKYGLQFMTIKFSTTSPTLAEDVASEFERLCIELGPAMDEVLARLDE